MDDLGSTTVHEVKVENKYRNGVCYHLRVCVCVCVTMCACRRKRISSGDLPEGAREHN